MHNKRKIADNFNSEQVKRAMCFEEEFEFGPSLHLMEKLPRYPQMSETYDSYSSKGLLLGPSALAQERLRSLSMGGNPQFAGRPGGNQHQQSNFETLQGGQHPRGSGPTAQPTFGQRAQSQLVPAEHTRKCVNFAGIDPTGGPNAGDRGKSPNIHPSQSPGKQGRSLERGEGQRGKSSGNKGQHNAGGGKGNHSKERKVLPAKAELTASDRKILEEHIESQRAGSRTLPDSKFREYFGKQCMHNYGGHNLNEPVGGVVYGNYMKTQNVNPHTGTNMPKTYQTHFDALNFAKRTKKKTETERLSFMKKACYKKLGFGGKTPQEKVAGDMGSAYDEMVHGKGADGISQEVKDYVAECHKNTLIVGRPVEEADKFIDQQRTKNKEEFDENGHYLIDPAEANLRKVKCHGFYKEKHQARGKAFSAKHRASGQQSGRREKPEAEIAAQKQRTEATRITGDAASFGDGGERQKAGDSAVLGANQSNLLSEGHNPQQAKVQPRGHSQQVRPHAQSDGLHGKSYELGAGGQQIIRGQQGGRMDHGGRTQQGRRADGHPGGYQGAIFSQGQPFRSEGQVDRPIRAGASKGKQAYDLAKYLEGGKELQQAAMERALQDKSLFNKLLHLGTREQQEYGARGTTTYTSEFCNVTRNLKYIGVDTQGLRAAGVPSGNRGEE